MKSSLSSPATRPPSSNSLATITSSFALATVTWGWPEKAPFDRILLTAAAPQVPKTLTDQLRVGGKLVAPEGMVLQNLVLLEKRTDGSLQRKVSLPVRFVPMVRE